MTSIRFANERTGWLFGDRLYLTTDGGRHWTRESTRGVIALEPSATYAFRVVKDTDDCSPCNYRIEQATAPAYSSWRALSAPPFGGLGVHLAVDGTRVYVAATRNPAGGAQNEHSGLVRSLDGGRTWQNLADPCGDDPQENDATMIAGAPSGFLAVVCEQRGDSRNIFLLTSPDGGRTWRARANLPDGTLPLAMAAGSDRALSIWATTRSGATTVQIRTTTNNGVMWTKTLDTPTIDGAQFAVIGFENENTGRAIYGYERLWTTRDGGMSWQPTKLP